MKKMFSNKRVIATLMMMIFSCSLVQAKALDLPLLVPVELRFVGMLRNQPLFQLSFTGSAGQENFTVQVKDELGNGLYRENFSGRLFSKKFLLNTDEIGDNLIRFEITCRNTKQSIFYEVNPETRVVTQWLIAETSK